MSELHMDLINDRPGLLSDPDSKTELAICFKTTKSKRTYHKGQTFGFSPRSFVGHLTSMYKTSTWT